MNPKNDNVIVMPRPLPERRQVPVPSACERQAAADELVLGMLVVWLALMGLIAAVVLFVNLNSFAPWVALASVLVGMRGARHVKRAADDEMWLRGRDGEGNE